MNTSMHSLCLILVLFRYWWNHSKKERYVAELCCDVPWIQFQKRIVSEYYSLVGDGDNISESEVFFHVLCHGEWRDSSISHQDFDEISGNPTISQSELPLPPLTTRQTARLACILCFINFIGAWAINASLGLTTVASATILSSISGTHVSVPNVINWYLNILVFFTLVIGRVFRVETLGLVKVGAVIMR